MTETRRTLTLGNITVPVTSAGRLELCRSMVQSGVHSIRDGVNEQRYCILISYDPEGDTFLVGWKQHIPAKHVFLVSLFDSVPIEI